MNGSPLQTCREGILYIDASAGAAGDMLLGALLDLGVPLPHVKSALSTLAVDGFELTARPVTRGGQAATKVDVTLDEAVGPERRLADLDHILDSSQLGAAVRNRAKAVFRRLVEAEAEAHGRPVDEVHLHEAGGVDAIVDVVGTCVALEFLGAPRICVSRMTTGFGSVRCAHGTLPVPAPATLALVRGFPVVGGVIEAERLTPTGAALLTTLADSWGPLPECQPLATGIGAGEREFERTANCVRVILAAEPGTSTDSITATNDPATEDVALIECTLDDLNPQALAFAAERLLEAGALDVFTTAVTMKKGRAGHHVTVIARPDQVAALTDVLLAETTTLGVRIRQERRVVLERSWTPVETPWGPVRIKVSGTAPAHVNAWPEYEDCATVARREGVPLQEVQRVALKAYHDSQ